MSEYGIILTTVASESQGKEIAVALVEAKLAACVNLFPVQSIYVWSGKTNCDAEYQLVIKTRLALVKEIVTKITALHDYDLPEIVTLPIIDGSVDYLNWLGQMTSDSEKV